MEAPWFDPETYRSDSNQHWRSGCPHDELRAGAFEWLQLLTHPEIWVYPGATMGETMRADARGRPGAPPRAARGGPDRSLREGRHRPRLGLGRAGHGGAPAGAACERRAEGPARRHRRDRAVGRPPPLRRVPRRSRRLRPRLRGRAARRRRREGVDVVLPQSSFDLDGLAAHRDRFPVPVLVSSPTRSAARTTRRRPTSCCDGWASRGRTSGASNGAARGRRRGRGARLPGPARLLQAGLLVRLARLSRPRPDRRPRAPAAERAARVAWRCGSRRRSSCCPTRAAPTCS